MKEEKKVIESTVINLIDRFNGKARTGTWINKNYWGKGYILEAKVPVLDFAFNTLKLRKIESEAFTDNVASNNMAQKLGCVKEGTRRKSVKCKATGIIHDINIYGLLKEEWRKSRPSIIRSVKQKIKS